MLGLETFGDFSAKTKGHIHNYVYKLEGLLAKESGRIGSEESNRSGGFLQDLQDTNRSGKFTFSQGVIRKVALSSSSLGQEPHHGQGLLRRLWRMVAPATWRARSSGERGKMESRPWGTRRGTHWSKGRAEDGRHRGGEALAAQGGGGVPVLDWRR
jgi:hypothetical protein